jgi:hypothetical protein
MPEFHPAPSHSLLFHRRYELKKTLTGQPARWRADSETDSWKAPSSGPRWPLVSHQWVLSEFYLHLLPVTGVPEHWGTAEGALKEPTIRHGIPAREIGKNVAVSEGHVDGSSADGRANSDSQHPKMSLKDPASSRDNLWQEDWDVSQ